MISMQELVGKGYSELWNYTGRYTVCKGSRASKKSKTVALWIISHLVAKKDANALYVRKTERSLKDSCFSDCRWAIHRMGLDDWFIARTSPLEIEYKPTGQKILFRGCDDPLKITSISVPKGVLCWVVFEEAYEITKETDFDMIDESIRGVMPEGYFPRIFVLLNPWSDKHWIKRRFFDKEDDDVLTMTTNYMCNEWLSEADLRLFERMKNNNQRRYQVAGLGNWGIAEGLVFDNWIEEEFDHKELVQRNPELKAVFGLDWGYTNDPSALFCGLIDTTLKILYVFDEMYGKGMSNEVIANRITEMGYAKERIIADSAEPKSIDRLRELGIRRIKPARKGKDSINEGIDYLQGYRMIVHPRCTNFTTEISNYQWAEDKFGNKTNKPTDDFNHLMDAMRYAVEDISKGDVYSFE